MKILYVTTVIETMIFFYEHIKMLQNKGHIIELACNCSGLYNDEIKKLGLKIHHIPFSRSVMKLDNIKAYIKIKELIKKEKYNIVHTHTPNASAIVRFACRRLKKKDKLKIIYTAHGFHFYKGAPIKNWLFFFPVEWVCAFWTDILITINREDYQFAIRWMKSVQVEYVPGVGIDTDKFQNIEINKEKIRQSLNISSEDIILLSVGELNQNKNHEIVIRALSEINDKKIHYVIAGQGEYYDYLKRIAWELEIGKYVHLLGYCDDIVQLYKCADIYVLPSIREGLNVSLMEAMASGLPCIASKIRGNIDLVMEEGGILYESMQTSQVVAAIQNMIRNRKQWSQMGRYNVQRVEMFSYEHVVEKIKVIYEK